MPELSFDCPVLTVVVMWTTLLPFRTIQHKMKESG
jgi:hypothetical protein